MCPICIKPRNARYENEAAGEACVHPCHWPYLSAAEVAKASIALDKITYINAGALRAVWRV
jgi:hypothetical protein